MEKYPGRSALLNKFTHAECSQTIRLTPKEAGALDGLLSQIQHPQCSQCKNLDLSGEVHLYISYPTGQQDFYFCTPHCMDKWLRSYPHTNGEQLRLFK